MPPRKSTSSVTPADPDDSLLQQSPTAASEKPVFATEQQLKARAEAGASVEDYLLPRSLTIRLAKSVLPPNTTIQKDAVLAMQKAATVFVSYLSSQANDGTLKRTIAPSDVFNALSELEFGSFRSRLEKELEAYTEIKAGKRKAKKADADADGSTQDAVDPATQDDKDVEMVDNPAKRVKRDGEGGSTVDAETGDGDGDGDETQEEEVEDGEDGEEEDDEEEDEESEDEDGEEDGRPAREDDLDLVEDLDREPGARRGHVDPDAEETDEDEDGPGSQLRDNLGLG